MKFKNLFKSLVLGLILSVSSFSPNADSGFVIDSYRFTGGPTTLLVDLVSWWSLDEATGIRFDAHDSNDLADINTVTQAVGKIANAGQFVHANSEYLSKASPTGLNGGQVRDFTIAGWVYMDTNDGRRMIIGMTRGPSGDEYDYTISYRGDNTEKFRLTMGTEQAFFRTIETTNASAIPVDTWHYFIGSYEVATREMKISLDNTDEGSITLVGTAQNDGNEFFIGRNNSSGTLYMDGRVDEVAFWGRLLTTDEKAELYNSGDGIGYPG